MQTAFAGRPKRRACRALAIANRASVRSRAWAGVAVPFLAIISLAGCQEIGFPPGPASAAQQAAPPPAPVAAATVNPPAGAPSAAAPTGLLDFVVAAKPGQSSVIDDAVRGGQRVTMEREYPSAAGLLCRRFTTAPVNNPAAVETHVACRDKASWHIADVTVKGASPSGQ